VPAAPFPTGFGTIHFKAFAWAYGAKMRFCYWAAILTASTVVATSTPAKSRYVNPTDTDEAVLHAIDIPMPLVRESKLRNSDELTSKRLETIKYNSWVLICRFVAGSTTKKPREQ
jgi:hypothetical protein